MTPDVPRCYECQLEHPNHGEHCSARSRAVTIANVVRAYTLAMHPGESDEDFHARVAQALPGDENGSSE